MPTVLEKMWERIVAAQANFYDFVLWLNEFSVRFFESEFAVERFGENAGLDSVIDKYKILPYLLLLLGALIAFFGRRFFSFQKFLLAFVVGFAIGAVYIGPAVTKIVEIDHFIIGVAIGLVASVFRTPLYLTSLFSVLTYVLYYQLVNLLHFGTFFAFLVAFTLTVLIFMFLLKWIELVGTALLGGYVFSAALDLIIPFSEEHHVLIFRLILFTVAALGFIVQFRWSIKKKTDENMLKSILSKTKNFLQYVKKSKKSKK